MSDKRKIKVAQIIGNVAEGGIEMMIMNFFRHINHEEIEFHFLVPNTSLIISTNDIEKMGGKVIITPSYKHYFKYQRFLKEQFTKEKYDIVHANMNALNFIPLKVAKKCGIKVRISHCHSTSHKKEYLRHLIKECLKPYSKKYATHLFACSEKAGRWLYGNKVFNKGSVRIINNAIDFKKFSFNENIRDKVRKELNIPMDAKVVGHVGRFMKQKNHRYLIDIFEELQRKDKNTYLLLVGSGENFNMIKNLVNSKRIKNVIFAGSVENTLDYYQAMDCFCLPSLYEGLPVVGVEAQTNGLKCFFSTEITQETKLVSSTEFLDLKIGAAKWAEHIADFFNQNIVRFDAPINSEFDIATISKKLQEIYGIL